MLFQVKKLLFSFAMSGENKALTLERKFFIQRMNGLLLEKKISIFV